MNGYDLTASIVQSIVSLGWPLALIACVAIFRAKLSEILPHLHLRHNHTEVSFRQIAVAGEASQIEQTAARDAPTDEEEARFQQHASISPVGAMMEAWADLESAVRYVAQATGMSQKHRPPVLVMRELRHRNLIDGTTITILDDLRAIRNGVAHGVYDGPATSENAMQFRQLADRVISTLRAIDNPQMHLFDQRQDQAAS